ncbi:cell division protein SepF [Halanaerobiaceae bacterium Z-7014]|uniref:Cell division protein SepF n=1 Tax=Halonatronomonas betaini TaxID=2778430 RepID=A0A931ARG4_9FIRM|nr:cell division protein SepF [Halonatronomonas betaini]MBF8437628.1 cell division protein SepF [Halonatronomonas betaini]
MTEESIWKKLIGFFGFTEENIDEFEDDYNELDNNENKKIKKKKAKDNKVIKLSRTKDIQMVVHSPESFDDVREIVDDLKESKAVILNLEERDRVLARRFIDFLSGSVYAINGNTQKIGTGVFIFTPPGIDVDARAIENAIKNEFVTD